MASEYDMAHHVDFSKFDRPQEGETRAYGVFIDDEPVATFVTMSRAEQLVEILHKSGYAADRLRWANGFVRFREYGQKEKPAPGHMTTQHRQDVR